MQEVAVITVLSLTEALCCLSAWKTLTRVWDRVVTFCIQIYRGVCSVILEWLKTQKGKYFLLSVCNKRQFLERQVMVSESAVSLLCLFCSDAQWQWLWGHGKVVILSEGKENGVTWCVTVLFAFTQMCGLETGLQPSLTIWQIPQPHASVSLCERNAKNAFVGCLKTVSDLLISDHIMERVYMRHWVTEKGSVREKNGRDVLSILPGCLPFSGLFSCWLYIYIYYILFIRRYVYYHYFLELKYTLK